MDRLRGDPLTWLLEPDPANPGVRFFALQDLEGLGVDDPEVQRSRRDIMASGPVPAILAAQHPEGYWVKAGSGYGPKYQGTVWQVILLAELGADPGDERVRRGCEYLLSHGRAVNGAFSAGQPPVPASSVHCLNGNLTHALIRLGYGQDPRVQAALDWQARAITGEGDFRYNRSGTPGPGFACGANLGKPCGWGAVKALKALSAVPADLRSPTVRRAVEVGVDFLFSRDPAVADYPFTERVSSTWFKFGFPLSYWSDVLEAVSVLVDLGHGADARLDPAFRLILGKQDDGGRWSLENTLNGKTWADIEEKGKPSKWVTLRALKALQRSGRMGAGN